MDCQECSGYMSIIRRVADVEGIGCYEWQCEKCGFLWLALDEDGDYDS